MDKTISPPVEIIQISHPFCLPTNPRRNDAAVRWELATGQQATLDGDGRTFAEIATGRGVV